LKGSYLLSTELHLNFRIDHREGTQAWVHRPA
jgi:hypothetical protein